MKLKDEIKLLIENWAVSRRGYNLGRLAQLSGIKYNTILRYAHAECDEPSLQILLSLIPIILPTETHGKQGVELLTRHFPIMTEFLKGISDKEALPPSEPLTKESFVLMIHASQKEGLTLRRAHGELGQRRADATIAALLARGAVRFEKDRYRADEKDSSLHNAEFILKNLGYLCEISEHERRDEPGSFRELIAKGLSAEGILRVQAVLNESSDRIKAIAEDSRFQGETTIAYGLLSTPMGSKPEAELHAFSGSASRSKRQG